MVLGIVEYNNMSKKVVLAVFGIFVILVAAGGGFFWWWQGREIKGSPEDYVIVDRTDGTFVENSKAGLSVMVPEGWDIEKLEPREGLLALYSPNIEGELRDNKVVPPLGGGCIIHVSVAYEYKDVNQLKLESGYNLALLDVKSVEFEEVVINDHQALKTIADTKKIGLGIGIDIPHKDRTYSFLLIYADEENDTCVQEFGNFLGTISIK